MANSAAMADSQEQQLRDALRIVADAASRGKLGHGFSLSAASHAGPTSTAANGNVNGENSGTRMSPQRQNPHHAAALQAASLMHAGTNGTQGQQQRHSQQRPLSHGRTGTDGAGHALGASLVSSAMQPMQTLTDEDYEFLSSLQQPLLGVGEGGDGSAEFYGGAGAGAATSTAALSAGTGMYNTTLGADIAPGGGGAATASWQTTRSGHAAAGASPHMRAPASSSTAGWQGQGRFNGSASQLGLQASAAAYDLPPWLTEMAAGAAMNQSSHGRGQGHGLARSLAGFAQGHHGHHGHSQTPSLSLGGTSPASSSVTGGGSEYSYTRTQLPNFMGSIALHSRGSPATDEAMLGAPADSPSTASVASTAMLARQQAVAARAPPPDLQPSFSMQENHLWAGLDTDEHIITPRSGAAAAAAAGGETLGGLGLDLNLDDYDLPLMPAGDLPDLDRQPADWLLTDVEGPAEWTEFDDDLAVLDDAMDLRGLSSHTGDTPASSVVVTSAPADGGHRPYGGLWDASLTSGGEAFSTSAASLVGARDAGPRDVDLYGMPPMPPPAAAAARAAAKRHARQDSDGGEGSSDSEEHDDGDDDDANVSGSKRTSRSSRSTKAKRTRTRKRRLASDLPPDELAKMREINRNAAKRHRAMARGRSRVRQHEYEMSEKRLLQTQADMRDLKMQLTTLRRLVLEMYGPGGPRTLAFLQSGSNASFLGI